MKKILFSVLSLCATLFLSAANLETDIEPSLLTVGGMGELILKTDGGHAPAIDKLPAIPGIEWAGGTRRSSSTQFINGSLKQSRTVSYPFLVTKKGSYIIPSLAVSMGREKKTTRAVTFRAVEAGIDVPAEGGKGENVKTERVPLGKLLYTRMAFLPERNKVYVGESVPVVLTLYAARNIRINLSEWPEISTSEGNAVFNAFKIRGQDSAKFDRIRQGTERIDNREYAFFRFPASVRPIAPGKLKLESTFRVNLIEQTRPAARTRSSDSFFDDPFFDSMFSRQKILPQILRSSTGELNVSVLPPKPEGTHFTGIVGKWNISAGISKENPHVGEAVTLTVRLTGDSSPDALLAPALEFPGFRVYAPEVEKNDRAAVIRYILIPTEKGTRAVTFNLCTFSPAKGIYENAKFTRTLNISPAPAGFTGTGTGPSVVDSTTANVTPGTFQSGISASGAGESAKTPSGILYLKNGGLTGIAVPLWKNALLPGILILIAGLCVWMMSELFAVRKKLRENDPGLKRRAEAARLKAGLLAKIRETSPGRLSGLDAEIAEIVNNQFNLPPGTDLREASEILAGDAPELSKLIEKLSSEAWTPVGASNIGQDFKDKLMKTLSRTIGIFLLTIAVSPLISASEKTPLPKTTEDAVSCYDAGNFAKAEALFRSRLKTDSASAELLYNLGNALYQQEKYSRALAFYEKALRIAPRDSDILENLNLTRRKLRLEEKYRLNSAGEFIVWLRDIPRPDEWLLTIAFGIAFSMCAFGARHYASGYIWKTLLALGAALTIVSGGLYLWQSRTSYRNKTAFVTVRNPEVRALPSEKSARIELDLAPGEEVSVEESRQGYLRIRSGAAEGWIPKKNAILLFPLSNE